jgi:hypothetical protein
MNTMACSKMNFDDYDSVNDHAAVILLADIVRMKTSPSYLILIFTLDPCILKSFKGSRPQWEL